jgi:hypothetical protein
VPARRRVDAEAARIGEIKALAARRSIAPHGTSLAWWRTMAALLLHSLKEFDEIIFAALDRIKPTSVLEIGSETGVFSKRLFDHCEATGAQLVIAEPFPTPELIERAVSKSCLHLFAGKSLDLLAQWRCDSEVVLIDGDHNYHTVLGELGLIDEGWRERGVRGVIFLHDVGFPCGRRDCYYDPSAIPEAARHPHRYDRGVTLDSDALIAGGFRGEGAFAWAEHDGGPENGVLTAVEDFMRDHPDYVYRSVDAVFGLGALTLRDSATDHAVADIFARYDNELVRRLERNRLELYLKVIELQDMLAARDAGDRAALEGQS